MGSAHWEVRVDPMDQVKRDDEWVQQERSVHLAALWVLGSTAEDLQDGCEVTAAWDPLIEVDPRYIHTVASQAGGHDAAAPQDDCDDAVSEDFDDIFASAETAERAKETVAAETVAAGTVASEAVEACDDDDAVSETFDDIFASADGAAKIATDADAVDESVAESGKTEEPPAKVAKLDTGKKPSVAAGFKFQYKAA